MMLRRAVPSTEELNFPRQFYHAMRSNAVEEFRAAPQDAQASLLPARAVFFSLTAVSHGGAGLEDVAEGRLVGMKGV